MNFQRTIDSEDILIEEPLYFNLEISASKTAFVLNGSKAGIGAFLEMYQSLEIPPAEISFKEWQRPERVWCSRTLSLNEKEGPDDPTPFKASSNNASNFLCDRLEIQFIDEESQGSILSVGYRKDPHPPKLKVPYWKEPLTPQLLVNRQGWKQFLSIVKCLKEKRYWFYVTDAYNSKWAHLPFHLTTLYKESFPIVPLYAMECIRLEKPEEPCFLRMCADSSLTIYLNANTTGYLLFSQVLREFVASKEISKDMVNPWSYFNVLRPPERADPEEVKKESVIHFSKVDVDPFVSVLSLGIREDQFYEIYVFGNTKGLIELADLAEQAAFRSDDDLFLVQDGKMRQRGYLNVTLEAPEGICLVDGWYLFEGGRFSPAYGGDMARNRLTGEERRHWMVEDRNFVNERLCYDC